MVNIGERIIQLRKSKNWSQDELAKNINASRIMIGKYERNESSPSADVLVRLIKAFDVSADYLLGEGELSSFDKDIIKRLEDIEQLDQVTRQHLLFLIDNVIQNYKTKKAFT